MKKVLWLVSWYPSRVDESNGDFIQRHAEAVAGFCSVYVIYVVKDQNKSRVQGCEEIINGNLVEKIIYYKSTKTGLKLLDRILSHKMYIKKYRQAVAEYININGKPDFVHVHVAMKAGLIALWIKSKWKIPFAVTENWTGYYRQSKPSVYDYNLFFRILNKKILKAASIFLPVTKDLGETIKNSFVNVQYQIVPNVVNTDLFYYKPFIPEKFKFIHFSYMNYQKNPEGILDAAKLLKEKGYDFEIVMTGLIDDRLISKAKNDNLLNETVYFHTAVPYCEVANQMQMASAFLLFSRFENLPCVILEALCCGLPVVSSNVGGISEVIDETNGILVNNEDTEQFAKAMQQLIDNYKKYDKEKIAGAAAAKFNYYNVGNRIANCYD